VLSPCAAKEVRADFSPLDHQSVKKELAHVLDGLPEEFRSRLHNVEIVIEQRPTKSLLRSVGLDPNRGTLYGLYQGTPLPDRSTFSPPILPDKITIFSEPLLRDFQDPEELRRQIRLTLLHEIAHYFGMDEDEIEKLGY
jgi:predicted Zn-dependent protease with MMP-like domain